MFSILGANVVQNACIHYLADGSDHKLFILILPHVLITKHNKVRLQILTLCRLQQLVMPSRQTVVLVSSLVATQVGVTLIIVTIVLSLTAHAPQLE
jgi:hypothetical protein